MVLLDCNSTKIAYFLCRLALGKDWAPPEETPPQVVEDLSMERLEREFTNLAMESKAHVSLIHLADGEKGELIDKSISDWISNFRVGGRTAYIAACDGCALPMSELLDDYELAIEAWVHCLQPRKCCFSYILNRSTVETHPNLHLL